MKSLFLASALMAPLACSGAAGAAGAATSEDCTSQSRQPQCDMNGEGETASTSAVPSYRDPPSSPRLGGPGAGNNPNEPGRHVAAANAQARAQSGSDQTVVLNWFNKLGEKDQSLFLANAAREGLVNANGKPFSARQFLAMSTFFDDELSRQGLSDEDKVLALEMIADKSEKHAPSN